MTQHRFARIAVALFCAVAFMLPTGLATASVSPEGTHIQSWQIINNRLMVYVANNAPRSEDVLVGGTMLVAGQPVGFSSAIQLDPQEIKVVTFVFMSSDLSLVSLSIQDISIGSPSPGGSSGGPCFLSGSNSSNSLSASSSAIPGTEGPDPIP
jgi:hypothetical protein